MSCVWACGPGLIIRFCPRCVPACTGRPKVHAAGLGRRGHAAVGRYVQLRGQGPHRRHGPVQHTPQVPRVRPQSSCSPGAPAACGGAGPTPCLLWLRLALLACCPPRHHHTLFRHAQALCPQVVLERQHCNGAIYTRLPCNVFTCWLRFRPWALGARDCLCVTSRVACARRCKLTLRSAARAPVREHAGQTALYAD